MVHLSPYIAVFEKAATIYPHKTAFKVPICKAERVIQGWNSISYGEFYKKLDIFARYWLRILKLPPGSVIGLWMSGMPFSDILHLFGIMRAGYIPHIVNSEITDRDVIRDVFKITGASAIIHTPQVPASVVEGLYKYFPCHLAIDAGQISLENGPDEIVPNDKPMMDDEDVVVIVQTSGSTSGRPKVIHLRRKWFDINARKRPSKVLFGDMIPRLGSFCHGGQLVAAWMFFLETSCLIMIPWLDFSAEHIIQMYNECGLRSFIQLTPLLSNTIRYARKNPQILAILQSFRVIIFGGAPLSEAEYEWCRSNKLTCLGITETGYLMASGQNDSLMRLVTVEGCSYRMVPIDSDVVPSEHTETQPGRLLELIVLSNSLDCPDSSHCDPHDGHFHTRDIFEEVRPGEYRYRCRLDDIIKMQNALKCDARYIEDRIYTLCGGLISACVVVGSGKPSPALIVEPNSTGIVDEREIIRRIGDTVTSINKGGYPHERVSPKHILLVSPKELPRTSFKHNIIRSAAEIKFKTQIDALYV